MPTAKELLEEQNRQKQIETPPPPISPVVTSSDTLKKLQETQDLIKLAKAEVELDEIKGLRDLPDKIKQRDDASLQREQAVKQREDSVAQREILVAQREQSVKLAEDELVSKVNVADSLVKSKTAEANKIIADANAYDGKTRVSADSYYSAKVESSKNLDTEISEKQAELDELNTEIPRKANALIKSIKSWTGYANQAATTAHYQQQYQKANSLWSLKESLNKLIKSIIG